MRKNYFIGMSDKELICYYGLYKKMLIDKTDAKNNMFDNYVAAYILMLEDMGEKFKYYDSDKKYRIGFSMAERDLMNTMARRFVELHDLLDQIKERV